MDGIGRKKFYATQSMDHGAPPWNSTCALVSVSILPCGKEGVPLLELGWNEAPTLNSYCEASLH